MIGSLAYKGLVARPTLREHGPASGNDPTAHASTRSNKGAHVLRLGPYPKLTRTYVQ